MSQKARSLRKRLKEKEVHSKPDKPEIENITTSKIKNGSNFTKEASISGSKKTKR